MSQVVGSEGQVNPASVAAQGQSQTTPATSLPQQDGFEKDRYEGKLDGMLTSVATGLTTDNIIKAKSRGRDNNPKKIKMAIEREFWRNNQVFGVLVLGFCIAVFAIITSITSSDDILIRVAQPRKVVTPEKPITDSSAQPNTLNEDGTPSAEPLPVQEEPATFKLEDVFNLFSQRGLYKKLGMAFLGVFFSTLIGQRVDHGIKKCRGSEKNPVSGVDPGFEGAQCLDDTDCTISNKEGIDVCARRNIGAVGKAFWWIGYGSLIPGIAFLAGFEDEVEATPYDFYFAFFLGFSGGYILNYYVVH